MNSVMNSSVPWNAVICLLTEELLASQELILLPVIG